MKRQIERQTDNQMDGWMNGQKYGQTDSQNDRQTDRQTYTKLRLSYCSQIKKLLCAELYYFFTTWVTYF